MGLLETEIVLDLTTEARVVSALSGSDPGDSTQIAQLITGLSQDAMINLMKRGVKKQARTERFDVLRDKREFRVLASPIDTAEDIVIHNNTENPRIFTQAVDLVDSDFIICDPSRASKGLIYINTTVLSGIDTLQIAYTAGMAATTAAFITAYPLAAQALDFQIAFMWMNKDKFGIKSEAVPGAIALTWNRPVNWLHYPRMVLESLAKDY